MKKDIYTMDYNNIELAKDIDIMEMDELTLKRIKEKAINRVNTYEKESSTLMKRKDFRGWFNQQARIKKIASVLLCFCLISSVTLGCITLFKQYVPGTGIVSTSSKLMALKAPYTIWKEDYFLRVTSFSYDPDSREMKFDIETNWHNDYKDEKELLAQGIGFGDMYFKEKSSQAMAFDENTGKGIRSCGDYNEVAEYHDEYILEKDLKDYYFELHIYKVQNNNGEKIYTDAPEFIKISLDELALTPATEVNNLEDFGKTVENSGIRAIAVSNWDSGKLYTDVLFESTYSDEKIVNIKMNGNNNIKLQTENGITYDNESKMNILKGVRYLMFETNEPVNGIVKLNSLFVEKNINKSILDLGLPELNSEILLNKELDIDGVKVLLKSIKAQYADIVGKDKMIDIEAELEIIDGSVNGRISNDDSFLLGAIKAGALKSNSNGVVWDKDSIKISTRYKEEDLKNTSVISIFVEKIMLTVNGEWNIPVVVK